MVDVAQLVRALVCGAGSRGFETHLPPIIINPYFLIEVRIFLFPPISIQICYN